MTQKNDQIEFLYKALEDAQAVIRAIDIKLGFLLLIVFTPLFALDKLGDFMLHVSRESYVQTGLIFLVVLFWVLSIGAQFMALAAISNPATKVEGISPGLGTFFSGNLYSLWWLPDVFWNRNIRASHSLAKEVARLPKDENRIIEELTFEKMKLAYIRSIKVQRFNFAVYAIGCWLACAGISYWIQLGV